MKKSTSTSDIKLSALVESIIDMSVEEFADMLRKDETINLTTLLNLKQFLLMYGEQVVQMRADMLKKKEDGEFKWYQLPKVSRSIVDLESVISRFKARVEVIEAFVADLTSTVKLPKD